MSGTHFGAVFFDLGGTLWDAFGGRAREQVTRDAADGAARTLLGCEVPKDLAEELSLGIVARMGSLRSAREAAARVAFTDPVFREDDLFEMLSGAAAPFGVTVTEAAATAVGHDLTKYDTPFAETVPVLAKIRLVRPDLAIGIVSNTVVQPAVIDHYLSATGLTEFTHFRVLSSELGWRKPHPAIYAAALSAAGVSPEDALFVGDRPVEDVMGPGRLGMRAILRAAGGPGSNLPAGCRPLAVIHDLYEVLPFLSIL